jgi:hypothetical protein
VPSAIDPRAFRPNQPRSRTSSPSGFSTPPETRLVDDRDVRSLVSVRIRDAKPGTSERCDESGELDTQPGLLFGLANGGFIWSLIDLDGTTDTPKARVCVSNEHEAVALIPDNHADGRQDQQLLPNQLSKSPHVIGYRHGQALRDTDRDHSMAV